MQTDGNIPISILFFNTSAYVSGINVKQQQEDIQALKTDLVNCQQNAKGKPTCYCEVLNPVLYINIICDATYQYQPFLPI